MRRRSKACRFVDRNRGSPTVISLALKETPVVTLETAESNEETVDDRTRPVLVSVARRGYAWPLSLGTWTDDHRAWLAERRCSSKRMLSEDVAAFLHAFSAEFDLGQIAITPFDDGTVLSGTLPFHPGLDWFVGLASEAAAAR